MRSNQGKFTANPRSSNHAIDQLPIRTIRDGKKNPTDFPFHRRTPGDGGDERETTAREMETERRRGKRRRVLTACRARDGLPSSSSPRARDSMLHPSPTDAGAGATAGAGGWGAGSTSMSTSGGSIGGAIYLARRLSPVLRRRGEQFAAGGRWLRGCGCGASATPPDASRCAWRLLWFV